MTISEFGRRSGLSHKALRLYDLSGLLSPAQVDPVSGYRLYSVDQVESARRISLLRQLEMPLATVANVLAQSDDLAVYFLDRWWAEEEASVRAKRVTLEYLRAQLTLSTEAETPTYSVALRKVAEAKVAAVRRDVDQQALAGTIDSVGEQLKQHLRAAGAEPAGEVWVIYHGLVTPDSEATVEVCMPFIGMADPAGSIVIRMEAAHTEATCTVTKNDCYFPRIVMAHEAVTSWVDRSGLLRAGAPREVYFADWDEIAGTDPCAHITQAVVKASR